MKKFEKLIFSLTLIVIGLLFNAFSFIYAVKRPFTVNGHSGFWISLNENDVLFSFILSSLTLGLGLYLLWVEAYARNIRKPWLSTKSEMNINKAPGAGHQEL